MVSLLEIMIYCTEASCTFQTSNREHFAMHMAIEHSNLNSDRVYELIRDLLSKLSTSTNPLIELQIQRSKFLKEIKEPKGPDSTPMMSDTQLCSAGSINTINLPAVDNTPPPSKQLKISAPIKTKVQRLIPNSRLNAGNLTSVCNLTGLNCF